MIIDNHFLKRKKKREIEEHQKKMFFIFVPASDAFTVN